MCTYVKYVFRDVPTDYARIESLKVKTSRICLLFIFYPFFLLNRNPVYSLSQIWPPRPRQRVHQYLIAIRRLIWISDTWLLLPVAPIPFSHLLPPSPSRCVHWPMTVRDTSSYVLACNTVFSVYRRAMTIDRREE